MKTFTVTFHHTCNYGALLQAYSLQTTLQNLGHENTIMEYPEKNRFYCRISKNPKQAVRGLYMNWLRFLRKKQLKSLQSSFRAFRTNRLNLSEVYSHIDELRQNPPTADCLITGSDQVWKMAGNKALLPARFLDFGADKVKRISYAASIEALNYTDTQKKQVAHWLSRFNGISLREQSAADYIRDITGNQDVTRVLDPVFLQTQEQWLKIATAPRIQGPYILCYQVQSNKRMQEVANILKKKTGYPLVAICPSEIQHIHADYSLHDVSPEEFLGLYNQAAMVVSASFHGTAFGLLFGKPTYGLVRSTHANRIREILALFGLEHFCIDKGSAIPEPTIDSTALQEKIHGERLRSLAYLNTQLKEDCLQCNTLEEKKNQN